MAEPGAIEDELETELRGRRSRVDEEGRGEQEYVCSCAASTRGKRRAAERLVRRTEMEGSRMRPTGGPQLKGPMSRGEG